MRIGSLKRRSSLDLEEQSLELSNHSNVEDSTEDHIYHTRKLGKIPGDAVIRTSVKAHGLGIGKSEAPTHGGIMVSRDVETVVL